MNRAGHDTLPKVLADTENLRQQLEGLHASVTANGTSRREQTAPVTSAGMVIKGK